MTWGFAYRRGGFSQVPAEPDMGLPLPCDALLGIVPPTWSTAPDSVARYPPLCREPAPP